ncbi:MAG: NAD(P)H-dependent oxidoreductase subunit E, partial [Verrucomicrobia bacterium]|nr:NAD(P)H-dependent oxidoreductase subunit E [Verrucomicrobiota bacterium]
MIIDDLNEIAEQERAARKPCAIRCCLAAGCMSSDSKAIKAALAKAVQDAGLEGQIEIRGVGCLRLCGQGPLVQTDPDGALYQKVTAADADALIRTLGSGDGGLQRVDLAQPFFTRQLPIVLANCGTVDPERIESYIAADGYQALHEVLREKTPKEVVDELIRSG